MKKSDRVNITIEEPRLRSYIRKCLVNEAVRYDMDREYLEAVQAGDMFKAGTMVQAAFKTAFPNTKAVDSSGRPLVVCHGTKFYDGNYNFNKFEHGHEGTTNAGGFFYATVSTELAARYGGFDEDIYNAWEDYRSDEKPATVNAFFKNVMKDNVYKLYVNIEHPLEIGYTHDYVIDGNEYCQCFRRICSAVGVTPEELIGKFKNISNKSWLKIWEITSTSVFADLIKARGYDGTISREGKDNGFYTVAVVNPNQFKSAEPVVYDDRGEIIPLSRRFTNNDDIRYEEE